MTHNDELNSSGEQTPIIEDLDLTPREAKDSRPRRRWLNWTVGLFFATVGGFVLYQALINARVYFLNVDEAVAQRDDLGSDTFRMQGTVISEPISSDSGEIEFVLAFGGEQVEVNHVGGQPSDLFELESKVVTQGHWEGDKFASQQILVTHSEEYIEDNVDRVNYDLDETVENSEDAT